MILHHACYLSGWGGPGFHPGSATTSMPLRPFGHQALWWEASLQVKLRLRLREGQIKRRTTLRSTTAALLAPAFKSRPHKSEALNQLGSPNLVFRLPGIFCKRRYSDSKICLENGIETLRQLFSPCGHSATKQSHFYPFFYIYKTNFFPSEKGFPCNGTCYSPI